MKRCILVATALLIAGCGDAKKVLGFQAPGGEPVRMAQTWVGKEDGGYRLLYALEDKDRVYTSARGTLIVVFTPYDDRSTFYFAGEYDVERSDFKEHTTDAGTRIWAHVIVVDGTEVDLYGSGTRARVIFFLETDDGEIFGDEDAVLM